MVVSKNNDLVLFEAFNITFFLKGMFFFIVCNTRYAQLSNANTGCNGTSLFVWLVAGADLFGWFVLREKYW
jgi:hypothetical protein